MAYSADLRKVGGGRVAAMEVMCSSLRVRDLILNGETEERTFYNVVKEGVTLNMRTFDQHLTELFHDGLISEKTALSYASHRSEVKRGLDTIKAARGERTSSIEGLALEGEEEDGWL